MANGKGDFTQYLVRQGVISLDQVTEARQMAKGSGIALSDALIRLGYASPDEVMKAVARQHGLDFINVKDVQIPQAVVELVPESVARENCVLPFAEEDGGLRVLIADPNDVETLDKLRFILDRRISIALAPREAIREAINRYYGQTDAESVDSMMQEFTETQIDFTQTATEDAQIAEEVIDEDSAPDRPPRAPGNHRGRATAGLGHPHRAVRRPRPHPLPHRRRAARTRQRPAATPGRTASPASRSWPRSTSPSAGGRKTAASSSPSARRSSICASACCPPTTASRS